MCRRFRGCSRPERKELEPAHDSKQGTTVAQLHVVAVKFAVDSGLTVWNSVPSLAGMLRQIKALKPASLAGLRLTVFGGEQLPVGVVTAVLGGGYLFTGDYFQAGNDALDINNDFIVINKLTLAF